MYRPDILNRIERYLEKNLYFSIREISEALREPQPLIEVVFRQVRTTSYTKSWLTYSQKTLKKKFNGRFADNETVYESRLAHSVLPNQDKPKCVKCGKEMLKPGRHNRTARGHSTDECELDRTERLLKA